MWFAGRSGANNQKVACLNHVRIMPFTTHCLHCGSDVNNENATCHVCGHFAAMLPHECNCPQHAMEEPASLADTPVLRWPGRAADLALGRIR